MNVKASRISVFAFLLILVFSLTACSRASTGGGSSPGSVSKNQQTPGNDNQEPGTSSPTAETTSTAPVSDYPKKPIRVVYTHGASGSPNGDGGIRLFLSYLEKVVDVPIVFENMPGAGGNIAREHVWKADPDGYTLLVSTIPSMDIGKIVPGGNFEPLEYEHIYSIIGNNLDGLAVSSNSPYNTLQDFVNAAKEKPGTLTIGGLGIGTNSHLETLEFQMAIGSEFRFVPFDGASATVAAVAGNQIDASIANIGNYLAFGDPSQLRVLGALGEQRDARAPDIPTFKEQGVDTAGIVTYMVFFAPPGTPDDVLDYLIPRFDRAAKETDYVEKLEQLGAQTALLGGSEIFEVHKEINRIVNGFEDVLKEAQP